MLENVCRRRDTLLNSSGLRSPSGWTIYPGFATVDYTPVVLRICCYDAEGQCRALCGKYVGVVVLLNRKGYDSFSMLPR